MISNYFPLIVGGSTQCTLCLKYCTVGTPRLFPHRGKLEMSLQCWCDIKKLNKITLAVIWSHLSYILFLSIDFMNNKITYTSACSEICFDALDCFDFCWNMILNNKSKSVFQLSETIRYDCCIFTLKKSLVKLFMDWSILVLLIISSYVTRKTPHPLNITSSPHQDTSPYWQLLLKYSFSIFSINLYLYVTWRGQNSSNITYLFYMKIAVTSIKYSRKFLS